MFYYSRDRGGANVETHVAQWSGLLQADAYSGYNRVYEAARIPGAILGAACWAHARQVDDGLEHLGRRGIGRGRGAARLAEYALNLGESPDDAVLNLQQLGRLSNSISTAISIVCSPAGDWSVRRSGTSN